MKATRVRDYSELSDEDALSALREAQVRRRLLVKTAEAQDELLRSRLLLINMPQKLKEQHGGGEVTVNKLTEMFHKVLRKQAVHISTQEATLQAQTTKIVQLQTQISKMLQKN